MGYSVICTSACTTLTGCLNPPCIRQSTESSEPMTLLLRGLRSTYLTPSIKWEQCFLNFQFTDFISTRNSVLLVPRGHDTPRHLVPGDCVAAGPCPGPPQLLDPDQRSEVSREELRLCGCEKMSQCERVNKTSSGQVNVMMSLLIIQIRNSLKRFKIY